MRFACGLFVLLTGCATVNESRLSEGCKALYQSCLDRCPDENARTADANAALAVTPARQSMGPTPNPSGAPVAQERQALSCEQDCAEQAKVCH